MHELIPIHNNPIGQETLQTVNAKELYEFLGVKQRFTDWIAKRIEQYKFEDGLDFTRYYVSNDGPTKTTEYHISIDMAKELSMVERTKKGKEARQYFLECERKALGAALPVTKVTQAMVSLQIAKALVEIEQRQDALEARQDAHDERQAVQAETLAKLQERQSPEGRLNVHQFLKTYSKPYLPREVLDVLKHYCRRRETPIMFRPDGFDNAFPYYTLETLNYAYAEATRQLSFLGSKRA